MHIFVSVLVIGVSPSVKCLFIFYSCLKFSSFVLNIKPVICLEFLYMVRDGNPISLFSTWITNY